MIASHINCFDGNELYDSFCKGLEGYLDDRKKSSRFFSFLSEEQFTIKDTGIKYRVINHWSQQGLLKDSRNEQEAGWRKFSFIDIFVQSSFVGSAFELARGDTATISRLLKADEQFTICSDEEINMMATTIAKADKPNFAVCQSIATIRTKGQERERIINEECKFPTSLNSIVLSYLFNPKPLENFQAKHGKAETFKQVMPS